MSLTATRVPIPDFTDPATFAPGVPFEAFDALRETEGLYWQPASIGVANGGFWVVTRFQDILDIEANPALFSSVPGGSPRRLPEAVLPASGNVHYIRTLSDVDRLRDSRIDGASFVVVGGGYVGLEIASVLARLGARITLIEAADRLLARVTSPVMSDFFLRLHRSEGVDVRLGTAVTEFRRSSEGEVTEVALDDGSIIASDQVLVGIGMTPRTELAESAGLRIDNGIVVDALCRTSADGVYAIGDVANVQNDEGPGRRLESMPNASAQARVVADHIVGTAVPHTDVPWFWSDQYDLKLQAAGTFQGADEVIVRGDPSTHAVCALYLRDGLLIGVDAVGRAVDYASARKILNRGGRVDRSTLPDGQPLAASSPTSV